MLAGIPQVLPRDSFYETNSQLVTDFVLVYNNRKISIVSGGKQNAENPYQ